MTLKANNSVHLLLECSGADKELLKDKDFIESFLNSLPEKIGMRVIQAFRPIYLDAEDQVDSGVSHIVMLAESHCSIHAFHNRGFFFADIFSCCDFDTVQARDLIINTFKVKRYIDKSVERGQLMDDYKNG